MYFCPGIQWIPTYRIELGRKKKMARIALQAEILNEVEDLEEVPIHVVVGVPNFRFRSVISPFSLEAVLRNALTQASPQLMSQVHTFGNAIFSQRAGGRQDGRGTLKLPKELTAAGSEDLFIYELPKIRLKRGHRAAVPIFDATAPYEHVYTWEVHLQRHDIEATPSGAGVDSPLKLAMNEVWHQIDPRLRGG